MILRKIPVEERPQGRLKVTAGDLLVRRRRDWGLRRKWEGNYLSQTRENSSTADFVSQVNTLKSRDRFSAVLFSSVVKKVIKIFEIMNIFVFCCHQTHSETVQTNGYDHLEKI